MAKIKVYRGIGADTKEELEKYIKDFYDKNIKAQGYGGGGNLGNGIYFTTDKNEAIAYSKANDYKEWKYSHVFEVEIDTDDFLPTDKIDDAKMLELDSEYKRLDAIMKSGYFNDDTYSEWIKAQDRALDKYVKLQNKKGVMSDNIFNIQNKDAIFDVPTVKDVVKSSNYWDKRAIKRLNEAEKTSDAYIKRIKNIYDQAYKDIDGEIARVYKNYSKETGLDVQKLKELLTRSETKKTWEQMKRQGLDKYIKDNYKSRISRLEQIQAQIYAKAKQIYPKEELEQTMCYKGVINNSYYKAVYDTQMGTGYDFSFNKIDNNLLNSILNEKWSGANYSQRIWGNTDILANSLSQVLGGALLSGQSIEKTTKQIKDRFNVSKYYAERLVRTETNHFNNEADAMAYEEMGIDKYVFVATLDSRTSETCQNHDGKVYEYKDKEVGVNFPPLHPNCRSKTRGYLGEEAEKTLKRRARNPITGKTELIDNISYKEWAKNNGLGGTETKRDGELPTKPVVKASKSVKIEPKDVLKPVSNTNKMALDNLPAQLRTTKEAQNSQLFIDAINNPKADPKVVNVYKNMDKYTRYDFKVSHAKNSSITYKTSRSTGAVSDVKLTIPNIKDANDIGNINTALHENMHFIDFMSGKGTTYSSVANSKLLDVVVNDDASIGSDIQKLFDEFNAQCNIHRENIKTKYNPMYDMLNSKLKSHEIDYKEYKAEWSKINKLWREESKEAEFIERNYMGGGISNLQDIYDALSRGKYRDMGTVSYGHGTRYFINREKRVKEIVADYGALSITRPDLVELLKADKPNLVKELDNLMEILGG